jgi:hypothetical protein
MTPWEIRAREFANCNCSYGCPCQFNALPTYGDCKASTAIEIDEGHYGDVDLAGVRFMGIFQWPGAVHDGGGKCQAIVDSRANAAQREAVLKIMSGEDTDPGATVFNVFASTMEQIFEPVFAEIDFEVDIDARRGRVHVKDLVDTVGEPIRNPVTGEEHRARIDIPDGFEYTIAEIGSASTKTQGNIQLDLKDSYAQFAHLHLNNHGIVRA